MTTRECAALMGVSSSWVRRHLSELPLVRLGRLIRFDKILLLEVINSRVSAGTRWKPERKLMIRHQLGEVILKGKKVKTWYGRFRQDIQTPFGVVRKQRRVRLGTLAELPTKNDARRKLAEILGAPPSTEMTFNELVDRWKTGTGRTYNPTTLLHYTNALRYVTPTFGARRISTINFDAISTFLSAQANVYSKSTIRSMKVVLGITLEYALRNEWIKSDPSDGVKLPKACCEDNLVKRNCLPAQQITDLVAVLSEPYSTFVAFMAETGARIGEAAGLRPEDFDGEFVHIQRRVYNGVVGKLKTKKSDRWVPVSAQLKRQMLAIAGEWIFCTRAGTPVDDGNMLRRHIYPACKSLGFTISGWHDLRHTFTTTLRKRGVHPAVISALVGHSKVDLAMNTYDRVDREDLLRAVSCDQDVTKLSQPTTPLFMLKKMVSAEGIEPSTY